MQNIESGGGWVARERKLQFWNYNTHVKIAFLKTLSLLTKCACFPFIMPLTLFWVSYYRIIAISRGPPDRDPACSTKGGKIVNFDAKLREL